MDFIKKNPRAVIVVVLLIITAIVLLITRPWEEKATFSHAGYGRKRRETFDENEVAEVAPVGTTQLDGDIPGHLASVNDPSFMSTPSIVLSTTSRGGENLSYKNITTDIRGSVPRVYGGSGSTFNQNIQLADTNIDPDTY